MLHTAYVQVADGLPGNAAAQINDGKLKLGRLGKADEPALMLGSARWSSI